MLKKVIIGVVCIVVLLIIGVAILFFVTGNAAKLTEYELGGDKLPSVNAVIGETRKVTGVTSNVSSGVQQKQYTYESASVTKDLAMYTTRLRDNGWIVTKSYDFSANSGEAQLGKESIDQGQILLMSIAFEQNRYAIKITKAVGQLNRK